MWSEFVSMLLQPHAQKEKKENVFEDFQQYLDGVSGCGVSAARKPRSFEDGRRQKAEAV